MTDNELKVCERFKKIRKCLKMKQGDFAKEIKTTQGHVSDIENKRKGVSDRVIEIICLKYNVNEEWLRSGIGEMFNPMSEDEELDWYIGRISGSNSETDISKKKLIKAICKLSDDEWEVLKKIIAEIQKE